EDGIRDATVTGVQTCALPISFADDARLTRRGNGGASAGHCQQEVKRAGHIANRADGDAYVEHHRVKLLVSEQNLDDPDIDLLLRSEERRVGKECDCKTERQNA